MKYNCNWVYSILPNRTEFMVTDRATGDIILDTVIDVVNNNDMIVMKNVKQYVKVFNYEKVEHRNATNYVGKGTFIKEVN